MGLSAWISEDASFITSNFASLRLSVNWGMAPPLKTEACLVIEIRLSVFEPVQKACGDVLAGQEPAVHHIG